MKWIHELLNKGESKKKLSEINDKLQQELLRWPGVSIRDHRFGDMEFRDHGREMRYLHGDKLLADLPFPKNVGKRLIAEDRASPYHILPQSGWISYYINGVEDIPDVIELFQMQYERMTSYGKKKNNNERPEKPDLTFSITIASFGEPSEIHLGI